MKRIATRIVALVLLTVMITTVFPVTTLATGAPGSEYGYDPDWKYWSQAGTAFTSSSAGARSNMASAGCFRLHRTKRVRCSEM